MSSCTIAIFSCSHFVIPVIRIWLFVIYFLLRTIWGINVFEYFSFQCRMVSKLLVETFRSEIAGLATHKSSSYIDHTVKRMNPDRGISSYLVLLTKKNFIVIYLKTKCNCQQKRLYLGLKERLTLRIAYHAAIFWRKL